MMEQGLCRLAAAVVRQAKRDLAFGPIHIAEEARTWLTSPAEGIGSFRWYCSFLAEIGWTSSDAERVAKFANLIIERRRAGVTPKQLREEGLRAIEKEDIEAIRISHPKRAVTRAVAIKLAKSRSLSSTSLSRSVGIQANMACKIIKELADGGKIEIDRIVRKGWAHGRPLRVWRLARKGGE